MVAGGIDLIARELFAFGTPQLSDKALELVAAEFEALPSRPKIVVEVFKERPSLDLRSKMESYGWTLEVVETLR
ncbi:hypothetical protein N7535_002053 [Penicillium sp. DV-2018c]|nr:hypothetical protein N7461_004703 [Penicillium sp. DV-2018c]KAJ5583433.1 hypothetical protein N7535_002053 [Penicillium sp. DV-2018c]